MTPETIALKRATAEMIKGVGGLEASAAFCRIGKSALGDNQSLNHPESFVAIDVVADLEPLSRERSGWPHVTQELCRQMGGAFVPLPEVTVGPTDVLGALGQLSGEFNDATRAVCEGFTDGRFCGRDAARLERELDEVIVKAVAMRELARTIKGERA